MMMGRMKSEKRMRCVAVTMLANEHGPMWRYTFTRDIHGPSSEVLISLLKDGLAFDVGKTYAFNIAVECVPVPPVVPAIPVTTR